MIEITVDGRVVKTVATMREAEAWAGQHKREQTAVIGKFSTEKDDCDYNEYRQYCQDYLYK